MAEDLVFGLSLMLFATMPVFRAKFERSRLSLSEAGIGDIFSLTTQDSADDLQTQLHLTKETVSRLVRSSLHADCKIFFFDYDGETKEEIDLFKVIATTDNPKLNSAWLKRISWNGRDFIRTRCLVDNGHTFGAIAATRNGAFTNIEEVLFNKIVESTVGVVRSARKDEHDNFKLREAVAMKSIITARSIDEPLKRSLSSTVAAIQHMLNPELISIFVCDHIRKEVFLVFSRDELTGLTLPFGNGIVGSVAITGEAVLLNSVQTDPRFCGLVDKKTGFMTKSMLAVPVPGINGRPLAVIQVINKRNGGDFNPDESQALCMLSKELSFVLRRKGLEIRELKRREGCTISADDRLADMVECSILEEYGAIPRHSIINNSSKARIEFDDKDHSSATTTLINNHSLDPFLYSEDQLIEFAVAMVGSYGLIERFNIPPKILRKFFHNARNTYRSANSFHNFQHAFGTMHLTFMVLKAGADQFLTPLDLLAVLLAALCHDADHPGNNNAFETACGSELSFTYADDAPLERHHTMMTLRLLAAPDVSDLLQGLTKSEREEFKHQVVASIMGTDMSRHFKAVEDIEERSARVTAVAPSAPYDVNDTQSRRALVSHVVHTADIGAQSQDQSVSLKWTACLISEFSNQVKREEELGLPVTQFMAGLDSELKQVQLQIGFIHNIVLPLWSGMMVCFPRLSSAVDNILRNEEYFVQKKSELEIPK